MSNDPPPYPPYPPPEGGQQPGGYPGGGNPAGGYPGGGNPAGGYPGGGYPAGGYPAGSYPPGPPTYGTPYGPPGQAGFGSPPGGSRSKRWYQRWWVWLIIVVVVVVVAGIAYGVNHVSGYQLEKKIKDAFSARSITVTNVHCPSNVKTDKGSTTSCTGVINGVTRTFDIEFDSDRHFIVTDAR
jgi:hypothetical protein